MTNPAAETAAVPLSGGSAWVAHAQRLAALLVKRGDVRDDAWRDAVAAVPRHRLVPAAFAQDTTGVWQPVDLLGEAGLKRVYAPQTLVTALQRRGGRQAAVSSSTKPDLMLRMLELLDVADGHTVLEIGTGTGYNAALLAHRLGDANVFSVDIDPDLVAGARRRLAEIGYHPRLAATDGVDGFPAHAPYDRIIATCSVSVVPQAWVEQLRPNGRMLVDLRLNETAGNLVSLTRHGTGVEGRFTARYASFMPMRHRGGAEVAQCPESTANPTERRTTTPSQPWSTHRVVWFLAQFALPPGVVPGMVLDPDTREPAAAMLSAPDGSWATIGLGDNEDTRVVTEAGPTSLWAAVEDTYRGWVALGRPDWPRLGVTATPDRQWLWLDAPDSAHVWTLSPSEQ